MRALWFTKAGSKTSFFRCGSCGTDHPETSAEGIFVMVANEVLAIICGKCAPKAKEAVSGALPYSFPDLDDKGQLL